MKRYSVLQAFVVLAAILFFAVICPPNLRAAVPQSERDALIDSRHVGDFEDTQTIPPTIYAYAAGQTSIKVYWGYRYLFYRQYR